MIINKNLFDDTFIASHRKSAIKSLQCLNNYENFIYFQTWRDNKDYYVIIPIIERILSGNINNYNAILKINSQFIELLIDKSDNANVDWNLSEISQAKIFVIIDETLFSISRPKLIADSLNKLTKDGTFEIAVSLNYIN